MSGGSFDYVYMDMLTADHLYSAADKLRRMREYAEAAFPAAVPYIEDMLQFIYRFDTEYSEKGARISGLLKAIEWEASSDWGEKDVQKALDELKAKPNE